MELFVAWITAPMAAYYWPLGPAAAAELAAGQDTAEAVAVQLAEQAAEQVAGQAAAVLGLAAGPRHTGRAAAWQAAERVALPARHGKPPLTNRFALRYSRSSL